MLSVQINKQLTHFTLEVDLHIQQEIVVLFGPSGSGKTTILNCIAGLTKPDQGIIRYQDLVFFKDGKTLIPTHKRQIGYVFQDYALFPHMTVWKNIAYGMKQEAFAIELMKELKIDHLKQQYPHAISGGEKQRVALARALATEPIVLLLDEPFSALDEKTRQKGYEELLRLHQLWKIPVILVTHHLDEARYLADRILFIDQGLIINEEIVSTS